MPGLLHWDKTKIRKRAFELLAASDWTPSWPTAIRRSCQVANSSASAWLGRSPRIHWSC